VNMKEEFHKCHRLRQNTAFIVAEEYAISGVCSRLKIDLRETSDASDESTHLQEAWASDGKRFEEGSTSSHALTSFPVNMSRAARYRMGIGKADYTVARATRRSNMKQWDKALLKILNHIVKEFSTFGCLLEIGILNDLKELTKRMANLIIVKGAQHAQVCNGECLAPICKMKKEPLSRAIMMYTMTCPTPVEREPMPIRSAKTSISEFGGKGLEGKAWMAAKSAINIIATWKDQEHTVPCKSRTSSKLYRESLKAVAEHVARIASMVEASPSLETDAQELTRFLVFPAGCSTEVCVAAIVWLCFDNGNIRCASEHVFQSIASQQGIELVAIVELKMEFKRQCLQRFTPDLF